MNCRKKCRKWWRSRNQGIVISNSLKQFANSEKEFANDTKEFANSEKQFANDSKEFANSEKQFANDTKEFANEKKETAQEVNQRKEFVKAKRAICKLITSNPKVTTAQIAVVYPRTISPAPQKNDFWVKVILHIIVFP